MRMLENELPAWLARRHLPAPTATLGLSMGGFGALSYALRRRTRDPLAATAVLSPALFATWPEAESLNAFGHRAVWEANDPLRRAEQLRMETVGVWCGDGDVFYDAAYDFAERSDATMSVFDAGDHSAGYWRRVLPSALRFIAESLH